MEKESFWCHIGQHKSNMDQNHFYSCSRNVITKETKRKIKSSVLIHVRPLVHANRMCNALASYVYTLTHSINRIFINCLRNISNNYLIVFRKQLRADQIQGMLCTIHFTVYHGVVCPRTYKLHSHSTAARNSTTSNARRNVNVTFICETCHLATIIVSNLIS